MKPIIDLSKYQNPSEIRYDELANNISGAILRCSYGSKYDSPFGKEDCFERHYNELAHRGVPLGVYYFLTEYQPVANQVRTFKEEVEKFRNHKYTMRIYNPENGKYELIDAKGFPLGLWLDVELEEGAPDLKKQTVHAFMQQGEAELGEEFGIYTGKWAWNPIMGGAYYTNRRLWVAYYGYEYNLKYNMPYGWNRQFLWQYIGDKGRIPGYSDGVDLNKFNGTEHQYYEFLTGEPPEETPPLTKLYRPCPEWAYITQNFGENPGWYPTSKGHNGIDFGFNGTTGHPIYAAADGVVEVSRNDTNGYGRHIRIRHSHGVTIYGHLSRRDVAVGDEVKAKQIIGLSGGDPNDPYAGFSTGPHLHFEYRWDIPAPQVPGGYVYNAVDPLPLLVNHDDSEPIGDEKMLYRLCYECYSW